MSPKIRLDPKAPAAWFDWNDMVEVEFADPPWLVKDLLPTRSRMLVFGDTDVGKSLLTLTLATCVLRGSVFLKKFPCRRGKVAYVSTTDMALSEWQPRYRSAHRDCMPERGALLHVQLFENPDIVRTVAKEANPDWLEAINSYSPNMVVIDIVEDTHLLNSNEDQTPGRVYGAWQKAVPGAAFVFVHHERKQPPGDRFQHADNPYQSFSGNHRWLGLVSGSLRVWKEKPAGPMGVEIIKARGTRSGVDTKFRTHLNLDTLLLDIGDDLWRRVWNLAEGGATPDEIVKRLASGKEPATIIERYARKIQEILEWRASNPNESRNS